MAYQAELTRRDGSKYPANVDVQLGSADGRSVFIAMIVDVTERERLDEERRQLEAKVQHTQKLESLGVLAGGIAHDFNNILMAVMGNAALALDDLTPDSPARESILSIESASTRAADLCKQMLAYSGRGKFVIKDLDLSKTVEDIGHMLQVSIGKTALLEYRLADDLPLVHADAAQIGQVILNLITNASDAIGEDNGVVSISTGVLRYDGGSLATLDFDQALEPGEYVFLEVRDTGIGMTDDVKRRMFEPFFSTKFTGRGLGLAAVLGIIRGHDGAITIQTEMGRGTTAKVLLPAATIPAEAERKNHPVRHEACGGTALLIDDEEAVRKLGRSILERMGYDVVLACDGLEGVEVFARNAHEIGFVLLDLTMPRLGGNEAHQRIREIHSDVPIIISSGYSEADISHQFTECDRTVFIQKPYRPHELAAKLNEVLGVGTYGCPPTL